MGKSRNPHIVPIFIIFVPHLLHVPFTQSRPFFILSAFAPAISTEPLHFMHQPWTIVEPPRLLAAGGAHIKMLLEAVACEGKLF
jgi:hypothetical protein